MRRKSFGIVEHLPLTAVDRCGMSNNFQLGRKLVEKVVRMECVFLSASCTRKEYIEVGKGMRDSDMWSNCGSHGLGVVHRPKSKASN